MIYARRHYLRRMALLACGTFLLHAENGSLWKSSSWTLQAPPSGSCGSLPLLEVKGPGSIFDPPNASALGSLQTALPKAVSTACPGVREVILVSGKTRRLIKLAEFIATSPTESVSAGTPVVATQATNIPVVTSKPALTTTRSELKSLSSARNIEDKCDVLLSWLESSKAHDTRSVGYRNGGAVPEVLRIFRDEPMTAVFGMPYDKTENRWRFEQHEKVMSRCLGYPTQQRTFPIGGIYQGRPNATLQKFSQQFAQYRTILDQAFLGQPGTFEPTTVARHVQQVRTQLAWANQALSSALGAPANRASFDSIASQLQAAGTQMTLLDSSEKTQVVDSLTRQQTEIAPTIVDSWFRDASESQKTVASAKVVQGGYSGIGPVLRVLDASSQSAWTDKYKRLVDSLVGESVRTEVAKLPAIPATLPGIQGLTLWKAGFDTTFGQFRGIPVVDDGVSQHVQTQSRILIGAMPAWQQEVSTLPMSAPPIAAKRSQLGSLFPTPTARMAAEYPRYEAPLKAKEDQLRVIIAAETRKKQIAAAKGAPNQNGVPVTLDGFLAKGLENESAFTMLFSGEIDKLGFDREDVSFRALLRNYIEAFWEHCKDDLPPPPNRSEIMDSRCSVVRTDRRGISGTCVSYESVQTGRFAKTELYNAVKELERQSVQNLGRTISTMFGQISQGDPLSSMKKSIGTALVIKGDVYSLVQRYAEINACKSPALLRFEENIRLFASNRSPLKLDGTPTVNSVTVPIPGVPYQDQNYEKLIDALVTDDSNRWGAFSRFVRGSITGTSVESRDEFGRPTRVEATYVHNDIDRSGKRGTVILKFTEGLPDCLAYSDAIPAPTCHTPNRKIVATYEQGGFQQ